MSGNIIIILGLAVGIISFLLWLIFDVQISGKKEDKEVRGFCPICKHPLYKGERIRSDQVETPKVEIKTFIKGCPYCLLQKRKRLCPVCKRKLKKEETILAISSFEDPKKLSIKGCNYCFPQGYQGYESKYK